MSVRPFHCAAEPAFDRLPLDDLQIHFSPEEPFKISLLSHVRDNLGWDYLKT